MDPTIRLPSRAVRALAAQANGTVDIAVPRDAATVVLVRAGVTAGPGDLEVHVMRRATTMAFASGMAVFPGGGVDPGDFDGTLPLVGPSAQEWASRLGVVPDRALAIVCAAARELFEECGILLAGASDSDLVSDSSGEGWELDRVRLATHEISLADLLKERNLVLRADLLALWSEWTTPPFESRRYRTWFFAASLPPGQTTRDVSTEAASVEWMSLRQALRRADSRDILMLPPQYSTCLEMFDYATTADLIGAAREVHRIEPGVAYDDEGAYLVLPDRLIRLGSSVGSVL